MVPDAPESLQHETAHVSQTPAIESIPYDQQYPQLSLRTQRVRMTSGEILSAQHPLEPAVIETQVLSDNYKGCERIQHLLQLLTMIIVDYGNTNYLACWQLLSRHVRSFIKSLDERTTLLHQFSRPEEPQPYKRIQLLHAETSERVWEIWCINFGEPRDGRLYPVLTPIHVHPALSDNNFSYLYEEGQPYGYDKTLELLGSNGQPLKSSNDQLQDWVMCDSGGKPNLKTLRLRQLAAHQMTAGSIHFEDDYKDLEAQTHPLTERPVNLNTIRYPHQVISAGHAINIYGSQKPDPSSCTLLPERYLNS